MTPSERSTFWRGKTVLVTGATGFLGGWLVRKLLGLESRVVGVVHRPKPLSQFYLEKLDRRCEVEKGSVYDFTFLESVLDRHSVDVVFHTAYGADVNRVLKEPLDCFRSSVESTWYLLELLRVKRPTCLTVVSSSDKAYGAQALPYQENQSLNPRHPYEVAKASQDLAAQSYGKVFGLPVVISRCGNYFGPYDFNFTRLIPGTVQKIAKGEAPVLRSDGRSTRDFLFIADAVGVQLLLAESLCSKPCISGEAFNFSYNEPFAAIDIVRKILSLSHSKLAAVISNTAAGEIKDMRLSSQKATDTLGWKPEYGFDNGLAETVKWYLDFFQARQMHPCLDATQQHELEDVVRCI